MAAETYFKNFNTIQYGNNTVVDITERIVTLNNVEKNPYIYYPLEIIEGARPDQITDKSYNDPYASWILYLFNDITDPYYEWPLTEFQLNKFIESKYNSMPQAMQKIAFWRNNWSGKEDISVAEYAAEINNNAERIKYWKANYNYNGTINSYSRTKEDWIVNTNKILQFNIDTTGITPIKTVKITDGNTKIDQHEYFIHDEIVHFDGGFGKAQVVQSNSTVMIVKNPMNYESLSFGTVVGNESNTRLTYTSSLQINVNNISDNVIYYWKPVTYYDVENEKNAGNRTIRLLQPQYVPEYIKNVKTLLSNT
jgi:hypothetical protein